MKNRAMGAARLALFATGVALGLTACSVATTTPSEAAKAAPDNKLAEAAPSHVATSQCSAVAASAPGACFHRSEAGHHGMCQPQSIPYARCRSHISTCSLGNTSPVQLFLCEEQRGYTSHLPEAGALMAIGTNHVHHMSTGHTLYVEEVCPQKDGNYKLRVSHTNYDRQCHLEEDAWVLYEPRDRHAHFLTGHWSAWGKHLPVQGFILHHPATAETAAPPHEPSVAPAHKPAKSPAKPKKASRKPASGKSGGKPKKR